MSKMYVVMHSVGGYCREDADRPACAGVFTSEDVANTVSKVVHGSVVPVEVDYIAPGYIDTARVFGFKL